MVLLHIAVHWRFDDEWSGCRFVLKDVRLDEASRSPVGECGAEYIWHSDSDLSTPNASNTPALRVPFTLASDQFQFYKWNDRETVKKYNRHSMNEGRWTTCSS